MMKPLAAALVVLMGAGVAVRAAETERRPVGKLVSPPGTVFQRGKPGEAWRIVPANGELYAGDLLLGLPGAVLETARGGVQLHLLADLDKNSPYPVLEAAVILHDSPDCAVDFTLDRGRVDVVNNKNKGEAHVVVRFHEQKWEAELEKPGTRIAMQLYGRWAKGARFTTTPGPRDRPAADLVLVVCKGEVDLRHGRHHHALSAPPGPALLHWDNHRAAPEAQQRLEKLPDWAAEEKPVSERGKKIEKALEAFRREADKASLHEALQTFVRSDDADKRSVAVVLMGATDNLNGLGEVLTSTRYPDTWDRAVSVVRHWIGRCAGQDQILYRRLIDKRGLTPPQAASILQLLHSFDDTELAQPELYKMLIKYLDCDVLGIRGLAYWHLSRLVPDGKKIGYNPLAPKEERDKARAEWKKLIDDKLDKGQLPLRD